MSGFDLSYKTESLGKNFPGFKGIILLFDSFDNTQCVHLCVACKIDLICYLVSARSVFSQGWRVCGHYINPSHRYTGCHAQVT